MNDIDTILAPACRALFGGSPAELGIALHASSRLRSSYPRSFAQAMWRARRDGDVERARIAAENTIAGIEVGA